VILPGSGLADNLTDRCGERRDDPSPDGQKRGKFPVEDLGDGFHIERGRVRIGLPGERSVGGGPRPAADAADVHAAPGGGPLTGGAEAQAKRQPRPGVEDQETASFTQRVIVRRFGEQPLRPIADDVGRDGTRVGGAGRLSRAQIRQVTVPIAFIRVNSGWGRPARSLKPKTVHAVSAMPRRPVSARRPAMRSGTA